MAKAKSSKSRKQGKRCIAAEDFNWGSIFTGTKDQLIAARLAKPEHFRFRKGDSSGHYWLPLGQKVWDGISERPPHWNATVSESYGPGSDGLYDIKVSFDPLSDMNVLERTQRALAMLDAVRVLDSIRLEYPKVRDAVAAIPPVPLSVQVPAAIAEAEAEHE